MIGRYFFIAALISVLLLTNGCKQKKGGVVAHGKNVDKVEQSSDDTHAGEVVELTAADFRHRIFDYTAQNDWAFRGARPAIVDFYATWCGPCQRTAPILAGIAAKYKGKIDVYKVDIDKQEELAKAFGISSIPALLFIPLKGQPQMSVGAMGEEEMEHYINDALSIPVDTSAAGTVNR